MVANGRGERGPTIPLYGLALGTVLVPAWWWAASLLNVGVGATTLVTILILGVAALVQYDVRRQTLRRHPDARELELGDVIQALRQRPPTND